MPRIACRLLLSWSKSVVIAALFFVPAPTIRCVGSKRCGFCVCVASGNLNCSFLFSSALLSPYTNMNPEEEAETEFHSASSGEDHEHEYNFGEEREQTPAQKDPRSVSNARSQQQEPAVAFAGVVAGGGGFEEQQLGSGNHGKVGSSARPGGASLSYSFKRRRAGADATQEGMSCCNFVRRSGGRADSSKFLANPGEMPSQPQSFRYGPTIVSAWEQQQCKASSTSRPAHSSVDPEQNNDRTHGEDEATSRTPAGILEDRRIDTRPLGGAATGLPAAAAQDNGATSSTLPAAAPRSQDHEGKSQGTGGSDARELLLAPQNRARPLTAAVSTSPTSSEGRGHHYADAAAKGSVTFGGMSAVSPLHRNCADLSSEDALDHTDRTGDGGGTRNINNMYPQEADPTTSARTSKGFEGEGAQARKNKKKKTRSKKYTVNYSEHHPEAEEDVAMQVFGTVFSLKKPRDVVAGASSGVKTISRGAALGFGSLFGSPVVGFRNHGLLGLLKGLGVGLVGFAAATTAGVLVGGFQMVRGACNTPAAVVLRFSGRHWNRDELEWEHFSLHSERKRIQKQRLKLFPEDRRRLLKQAREERKRSLSKERDILRYAKKDQTGVEATQKDHVARAGPAHHQDFADITDDSSSSLESSSSGSSAGGEQDDSGSSDPESQSSSSQHLSATTGAAGPEPPAGTRRKSWSGREQTSSKTSTSSTQANRARSGRTLYDLLDLDPDTATTTSIRKAYYKKSLLYHPDKLRSRAEDSSNNSSVVPQAQHQVERQGQELLQRGAGGAVGGEPTTSTSTSFPRPPVAPQIMIKEATAASSSGSSASSKFHEITRAYQVLGDPQRRQVYDESLRVESHRKLYLGERLFDFEKESTTSSRGRSSTCSSGLKFDLPEIDPGLFFAVLFGSQHFEPYVGKLHLAQFAEAEQELANSRMARHQERANPVAWPAVRLRKLQKRMQFYQRKRECDCCSFFAETLLKPYTVGVAAEVNSEVVSPANAGTGVTATPTSGSSRRLETLEEFDARLAKEAQRLLAEAANGREMLKAIGWVYRNQGEQFANRGNFWSRFQDRRQRVRTRMRAMTTVLRSQVGALRGDDRVTNKGGATSTSSGQQPVAAFRDGQQTGSGTSATGREMSPGAATTRTAGALVRVVNPSAPYHLSVGKVVGVLASTGEGLSSRRSLSGQSSVRGSGSATSSGSTLDAGTQNTALVRVDMTSFEVEEPEGNLVLLSDEEREAAQAEKEGSFFLDALWEVTLVDVQQTSRRVCRKLCQDRSATPQERLRRIEAIHRLGEIFLKAASSSSPLSSMQETTPELHQAINRSKLLPPGAAEDIQTGITFSTKVLTEDRANSSRPYQSLTGAARGGRGPPLAAAAAASSKNPATHNYSDGDAGHETDEQRRRRLDAALSLLVRQHEESLGLSSAL
ncbi:unnamed protein product [Amoebophrya sp. A120]|nr:unnamed protein product [Amoebophrya sp. A120]|eukprot:GSA120T00025244001.1